MNKCLHTVASSWTFINIGTGDITVHHLYYTPVLGHTQCPVQVVSGPVSSRIKPTGREADISLVLRIMCVELYLRSTIRLNGTWTLSLRQSFENNTKVKE